VDTFARTDWCHDKHDKVSGAMADTLREAAFALPAIPGAASAGTGSSGAVTSKDIWDKIDVIGKVLGAF